MNLFEAVKTGISTREAAERYGVDVNRYGKALCPFHNDRHPSLYVADDHYHCFACGEHGDVIDFAARLYDLSLHEAAQRLASDFGLSPDNPPSQDIQDRLKRKTEAQRLRENERLCFSVLTAYLRLLREWKVQYAPQTPEDIPDERFVEACHYLDHMEYLLDVLSMGDSHERGEVVEWYMTDNRLTRLQEKLRYAKEEEQTA